MLLTSRCALPSNGRREEEPLVKTRIEFGYNAYDDYDYERRLIGLPNLGNTCYLNAVLQLLMRLPAFHTLPRQKYHRREVGGKCLPSGKSDPLDLVNAIEIGALVAAKNGAFATSLQQDAHE